MRSSAIRALSAVSVAVACAARIASADDAPEHDETEINRQVTNPIPAVWSMKIKNEMLFLDRIGQSDRGQYQLQFQPTMPVELIPGWRLIARPQVTLIDDKPYTSQGTSQRATGFGDTILDLAVGREPLHWLVALGPTFIFPTASSHQTGQGKFQIGPGGVLGYQTKEWTAYAIAQQWWSFAGEADRASVSELHLQYVASWFLSGGWSVGTSPTIKVDWRASPGNRVTFPLGVEATKVVKLGSLPVKVQVQGLYAPIRPDSYGEKFGIQLYVIPVVPTLIGDALFGR